jgi:hypothetical protein
LRVSVLESRRSLSGNDPASYHDQDHGQAHRPNGIRGQCAVVLNGRSCADAAEESAAREARRRAKNMTPGARLGEDIRVAWEYRTT